jgi:N-(5'phosphoribosyl)anthranilate (PRA) isomerase
VIGRKRGRWWIEVRLSSIRLPSSLLLPRLVRSRYSKTPQIPHLPLPIIIAGGLTPTNVRAAIDAAHPWAVDVSTGVERAEGGEGEVGKDSSLIKRFVCAVRGEVYSEGEGEEDEDEDEDEMKDTSLIYLFF